MNYIYSSSLFNSIYMIIINIKSNLHIIPNTLTPLAAFATNYLKQND